MNIRIYFLVVFSLLTLSVQPTWAQRADTLTKKLNSNKVNYTEDDYIYSMPPLATVFIFGKGKKRPNRLYRNSDRLMRIIRKVYPIAQEANTTLRHMEKELLSIKGEKAQKAYIATLEKEIKKKYTPILLRMSTTEGLILLKLIDRETGNTSYQLVKELRGSFSAFFWQGIARFFSINLKSEYDALDEDWYIEQYIHEYENERLQNRQETN